MCFSLLFVAPANRLKTNVPPEPPPVPVRWAQPQADDAVRPRAERHVPRAAGGGARRHAAGSARAGAAQGLHGATKQGKQGIHTELYSGTGFKGQPPTTTKIFGNLLKHLKIPKTAKGPYKPLQQLKSPTTPLKHLTIPTTAKGPSKPLQPVQTPIISKKNLQPVKKSYEPLKTRTGCACFNWNSYRYLKPSTNF